MTDIVDVPVMRRSRGQRGPDKAPRVFRSRIVFDAHDMSWQDQAACRDVEGNEWFTNPPTQGTEHYGLIRAWMKRTCLGCPVFAECDAFAKRTGAVGVYMAAQTRSPNRRIT